MRCPADGGRREEALVFRNSESVRGDSGFTIAEYIAAIAILMTVVIGAMTAITYASTTNASTVRRDEATTLMNRQIELARNQPYDDLGSTWPGTNPEEVGDYTIDTEVGWARDDDDRATARLVKVTVSWETPRPGSVSAQTRIFGKSDISNVGDVIINVLEPKSNGDNDPVQGVAFQLTPSLGSVQRVTSDAEGVAFFGRIAAGTFTFAGRKNGYVVDHSPYVTPPMVIGGEKTICTVMAYKASSHRFVFECPTAPSLPEIGVDIAGVKSNAAMTKEVTGSTTTFGYLLPDTYSITYSIPTGYQLADGSPTNFSIPAADTHSSTTITLVKNTVFVVTVNDDRGSGYPVEGASVSLTGPSSGNATTDASGRVSFVIPTTGTYTITTDKNDFVGSTFNRSLAVGTDDAASTSITRYGTLSARYSSGTSNRTLYVYDSNRVKVAQGATTGSGSNRWAHFSLPPAEYYYVSTRSSWPTSTYTPVQSGEVVPGDTTSVVVTSSN